MIRPSIPLLLTSLSAFSAMLLASTDTIKTITT